MNDNGTSDNGALIVCERYLVIHVIQFRGTRSVRLQVAHVAYVPFCRIGPGVRFIRGIEMSASRGQIRRAAIAEFMHMKAMLAGAQAGDFCLDLHSIGYLSERDGAAHFVARRRMKHGDGFQRRRRFWLRRLRGRCGDSE